MPLSSSQALARPAARAGGDRVRTDRTDWIKDHPILARSPTRSMATCGRLRFRKITRIVRRPRRPRARQRTGGLPLVLERSKGAGAASCLPFRPTMPGEIGPFIDFICRWSINCSAT